MKKFNENYIILWILCQEQAFWPKHKNLVAQAKKKAIFSIEKKRHIL